MKSRIRQFIEDVRQEERLPDILGERCVHARIQTASCRACVEICPQGAWLLDDDALRLNTQACDGCGLCVPACPESAIHVRLEVAIGQWQATSIALCACEITEPTEESGILPCIHAVGLTDILRLYHKGINHWAVRTADCNSCPRGQFTRLNDRLEALNHSLLAAGFVGISLNQVSETQWQRLVEKLSGLTAGPQFSRRGFISNLMNTGVRQGLEIIEPCSDPQSPITPPGQRLPYSTTTTWPYLPEIDSHLCNGCDACATLCQHGAIDLEKTRAQLSYRLKPQNCTGCRICIDVCEQQAVILSTWKEQSQRTLPLTDFKCTCCGNPLHVPAEQSENSGYICRICMQKNHYKNLYQVLD